MVEPTSTSARYGDARRAWHPAFVSYMEMIVDHPNYAGMPCTRDDQGKIDWTIPSNRTTGSKNWDGNARRRVWWRERAEELNVPLEGPWMSEVARRIHPTGAKPCQTCGRVMRLDYAYPTLRTLEAINRQLPFESQIPPSALLSIFEIARAIHAETPELALQAIGVAVPEAAGARDLAELEARLTELAGSGCRRFSPGAMANPPDRLDGFHTYNLCCRGSQDTGRTRENLATYSIDRRAYEQWCEGDWAAANALMSGVGIGICRVPTCHSGGGPVQLTADHVGPISLGFRHSPRFNVACQTCNSGKGNRMSLEDVQTLIRWEEEDGRSVVSWQAQRLWDSAKAHVDSTAGALLLSRLMRINQHHYLAILGEIAAAGGVDALVRLLGTEQAANRYRFVDLDPTTLQYSGIEVTTRQDTYSRSMSARMTRIAFESLSSYSDQGLRNVQAVPDAALSDEAAAVAASVAQLVATPSSLREALAVALARTDGGQDAAVDAALSQRDGDALLEARRDAVIDALQAYMSEVQARLAARFEVGTHMTLASEA